MNQMHSNQPERARLTPVPSSNAGITKETNVFEGMSSKPQNEKGILSESMEALVNSESKRTFPWSPRISEFCDKVAEKLCLPAIPYLAIGGVVGAAVSYLPAYLPAVQSFVSDIGVLMGGGAVLSAAGAIGLKTFSYLFDKSVEIEKLSTDPFSPDSMHTLGRSASSRPILEKLLSVSTPNVKANLNDFTPTDVLNKKILAAGLLCPEQLSIGKFLGNEDQHNYFIVDKYPKSREKHDYYVKEEHTEPLQHVLKELRPLVDSVLAKSHGLIMDQARENLPKDKVIVFGELNYLSEQVVLLLKDGQTAFDKEYLAGKCREKIQEALKFESGPESFSAIRFFYRRFDYLLGKDEGLKAQWENFKLHVIGGIDPRELSGKLPLEIVSNLMDNVDIAEFDLEGRGANMARAVILDLLKLSTEKGEVSLELMGAHHYRTSILKSMGGDWLERLETDARYQDLTSRIEACQAKEAAEIEQSKANTKKHRLLNAILDVPSEGLGISVEGREGEMPRLSRALTPAEMESLYNDVKNLLRLSEHGQA